MRRGPWTQYRSLAAKVNYSKCGTDFIHEVTTLALRRLGGMRTRLTLLLVVAVAAATAVATAATAASGEAAARPSVRVGGSNFGQILFDGRGFALYAFTRDRERSACYGACAKAWPPYIVRGRLVAGRGTKASLLGTTRRTDGTRQLTYAGRPLYYYVGDRESGQVLCQDVVEFGGTWLVVRGSGALVR
jgi:predicted lipoprotein with Yx(FWY)xxD motif